jgi:hypothetical protein
MAATSTTCRPLDSKLARDNRNQHLVFDDLHAIRAMVYQDLTNWHLTHRNLPFPSKYPSSPSIPLKHHRPPLVVLAQIARHSRIPSPTYSWPSPINTHASCSRYNCRFSVRSEAPVRRALSGRMEPLLLLPCPGAVHGIPMLYACLFYLILMSYMALSGDPPGPQIFAHHLSLSLSATQTVYEMQV